MVVLLLVLGFGLPGIVIGWSIGDSLNAKALLANRKSYFPHLVSFACKWRSVRAYEPGRS